MNFMNKQISKKTIKQIIASNKRALHDYSVKQRFEAGIVLEGWEVKSIRAGHVQLWNSYVTFKNGESWLIGSRISPLPNVDKRIIATAQRLRKLLLNKFEIEKLFGSVQKKALTVIPLDFHWYKNYIKADIALVKGKKRVISEKLLNVVNGSVKKIEY